MKKAITLLSVILLSIYTNAQTDVAAVAITPSNYQVPGTTDFGFTFKNTGTGGIASYNVYWQFENGPVHSVSKVAFDTKVDGIYGLVQDPSFKINFPTPGIYTLKAWVKLTTPADINPTNDTIVAQFTVKNNLPKKNVLLEIFKHQTCGPCYKAAKHTNDVITKNSDYAIACIYTSPADIVYCADGKIVNDQYSFPHPMPVFDRYKFPFRSTLGTRFSSTSNGYELIAYGEREQFYEPVQVFFNSANYNSSTREIKVRVGAKFYDDLNGDYRFNLYVVEDSIKGYQASAPDPNNYYHMQVVRTMLGGAWGKQGSLPTIINNNDVKYYDFTYTIPANYNTDKIRLIAMVQTYNNNDLERRVLNSQQITFQQAQTLSARNIATANTQLNAYPNPVTDQLSVSFANKYDLRIVDLNGKVVYQKTNCSGEVHINMNTLPTGNYILHADDGQIVHTKTIVKE